MAVLSRSVVENLQYTMPELTHKQHAAGYDRYEKDLLRADYLELLPDNPVLEDPHQYIYDNITRIREIVTKTGLSRINTRVLNFHADYDAVMDRKRRWHMPKKAGRSYLLVWLILHGGWRERTMSEAQSFVEKKSELDAFDEMEMGHFSARFDYQPWTWQDQCLLLETRDSRQGRRQARRLKHKLNKSLAAASRAADQQRFNFEANLGLNAHSKHDDISHSTPVENVDFCLGFALLLQLSLAMPFRASMSALLTLCVFLSVLMIPPGASYEQDIEEDDDDDDTPIVRKPIASSSRRRKRVSSDQDEEPERPTKRGKDASGGGGGGGGGGGDDDDDNDDGDGDGGDNKPVPKGKPKGKGKKAAAKVSIPAEEPVDVASDKASLLAMSLLIPMANRS